LIPNGTIKLIFKKPKKVQETFVFIFESTQEQCFSTFLIQWHTILVTKVWCLRLQKTKMMKKVLFLHTIVKIDSRTWSFCLCQYVQNGLSYPGKETQPTLCLKGRQANFGVSSLGTNKDQLLHRIQRVWTFTNLQ